MTVPLFLSGSWPVFFLCMIFKDVKISWHKGDDSSAEEKMSSLVGDALFKLLAKLDVKAFNKAAGLSDDG